MIQAGPSLILFAADQAALYCFLTIHNLRWKSNTGEITYQRAGDTHGGSRLYKLEDLLAWRVRQGLELYDGPDLEYIKTGPSGVLLERDEAAEQLGLDIYQWGNYLKKHPDLAIRVGRVNLFRQEDIDALKGQVKEHSTRTLLGRSAIDRASSRCREKERINHAETSDPGLYPLERCCLSASSTDL